MYALWLVFSRAVLCTAFVLSFSGKVRNVPAFVVTIHRFQLLPRSLAKAAATVFLITELLIILLLAGGVFLIVGFGIAVVLLLLFTGALAGVLHRKQVVSCNCFGATKSSCWLV